MRNFTATQNFSDVATKTFDSEIEKIDFAQSSQAAASINDWVAKKTNNKIKNIANPSAFSNLTRAGKSLKVSCIFN